MPTYAPAVRYDVSIEGTNAPLKIARSHKLEQYIVQRLLPEVGNVVRKNIINRIANANFKHSTGRMKTAVKVRVNASELSVEIGNDDKIAPYARWQEIGVRRHAMTYLLNHHNPNTIPFKMVGGQFTFAGRGSKFYGNMNARGVRFARVTPESFAKGKFINPGYPGKYLYRGGLSDSLNEIHEHMKMVTFKVVQQLNGEGGGVQNATT